MIRQRNAVRFLIAPPLFGKTAGAAEYAESVFAFQDVFWISGKSPCFLRDLDGGAIIPFLMKKGLKPALAVFEDVPLLDDKRADALSAAFDELLAHGWEVVATMTPLCDVFRDRQPDGVRLKAPDLLLSDQEIDARLSDIERLQRPAAALLPTERIPGLFWGDGGSHERFCQAIAQEELAIDERLTLFAMLVLRKGQVSDIALFVKGWDAGLLENLQSNYAYLGIDLYHEEFSACTFSLECLTKAFMPFFGAMAAHSNFGEKDTLTHRLADLLVIGGDAERACELVLRMCHPRQRLGWLDGRGGQLFKRGAFLPAHRVFESISPSNMPAGSRVAAFEAFWLALLGDEAKAVRIAKRLYLAPGAEDEARAFAALVMFYFGDAAQAQRALAVLGGLARIKAPAERDWGSMEEAKTLVKDGRLWKVLAAGRLCLCHAPDAAPRLVEALRLAGADRGMLSLVLSWLLAEASASAEDGMGTGAQEAARGAGAQEAAKAHIRSAAAYLERRAQEGDIGFFDTLLLSKLERACAAEGLEGMGLIPRSLLTFAHEMEVSLFNQRKAYQRLTQEAEARRSEFRRTHPDGPHAGSPSPGRAGEPAPRLYVRLFGGLEVRIGEKVVDPRLFSRRKVKALLALLVINQGKEFSRERLCSILWPESNITSAQRNLYSIWSQLKKALSGPEGGCPYLIHTQFSYKLDAYIASSDVAEFEALCRRLLFADPDPEAWSQAFVELEGIYTDDLLPTETENQHLAQAREEYRNRLVDAFSAAAYRLLDAGEFQSSLWFARAALARDPSREDIYTVLMQAHIALGQRAAALETYFRCRRHLVEELGIDPSEKATRLYTSIISEEPGFKDHGL